MIIDGYETFDHEKRTDFFVKFFIDVGPKLASILPESQM